MDARADRTELRLKLYENGFTPLPNRLKACFLKGWSTVDVTPELIQSKEWARNRSWSDTGVRCGDVVAIDLDVNDEALFNELADALIEQGIVAESPFIRIGKPPRQLWVYRTADKIGKRTTGHFIRPGAGEDDKGEAVEILGAGCQFGAYGQRSEDVTYTWPFESLVDHPYMDLPEITLAQIEAVKTFAVAFFESHGLERHSPAGGTDHGYTHAYTLTDDMSFDIKDLGPMTVAELHDYFVANPDDVLRCTVSTLRPTSGSWAGMISAVDGEVCLSDHGTYTSHFPKALDAGAAVSRLAALLADRLPAEPAEEPPSPEAGELPDTITDERDLESVKLSPANSLDDNLAMALRRFVYVMEDDLIHDLAEPGRGYNLAHFRNVTAQYVSVKTGPRGGEIITRLAEVWMQDAQRVSVKAAAMRPDKPRPIYAEDGSYYLNTYRPRRLPETGDAGPGFAMLETLLPDAGERAWFTQWLAHKILHPEVPGPGVVMVANDSYGTGRGSLIALLADMFGERYVRQINFATITGQNYQSQYNDWQTDSLIICVDEAQDLTGDASRWRNRHTAYEHLKSIIDPGARNLHVARKGVDNIQGRTFASVFIATNHSDALVIPRNDRRLAVLENGAPMPSEYWRAFHLWRSDPANVGAFRAAVARTDLTGYDAYDAPMMTRAKADMIDAGTSDLDRAIRHVLEHAVGGMMVREQMWIGVEDFIAGNAVDMPEEWKGPAEKIFKSLTRKPTGTIERVRIDQKYRQVRIIPKKPIPADALQSEAAMLQEVNRNGPLIRPVTPTGKVISFGGPR